MSTKNCPKCGRKMIRGSRTPDGRVRWQCRDGRSAGGAYCYSTTDPRPSGVRPQGGGGPSRAVFKRELDPAKTVFVVTAAQNATPVHPRFWRILKVIEKHRGGELLVVPIRYKNPTSRWTASQANEEQWAEEVVPYLWNQRLAMNQNLVLLADVKTQPTAVSPLTGFDAMSGAASAVLGHTKIQLRAIATPSNRMAKVLTTTGACTAANYTDSRAGKLGAFHHSLAAVVIEVTGRTFHIRQLHYDEKTGTVTDLDVRYTEQRATRAPRALALVMGDTHVDAASQEVEAATFGKGGIVDTVKPKHLVWHDLLDGYSCNPHHRGNPFVGVAKARSRRSSVMEEVERACEYVEEHTPRGTTSVVVPSNHNDFLRRWVMNTDWRTDPGNAEFYLRLALEMVQETRMTRGGTEHPDPFQMVMANRLAGSGVRVLRTDESFAVGGVELGMHGDRGPNGARGSLLNHRRLGVKSIIAHSHTPGIDEGCYQVGTSTQLRLEYNLGPSSWLNAHCVLGADGKRQLVLIVDGKWRG